MLINYFISEMVEMKRDDIGQVQLIRIVSSYLLRYFLKKAKTFIIFIFSFELLNPRVNLWRCSTVKISVTSLPSFQ